MNLLGHLSGRNRKQPREPDAPLSALLQQWQGAGARPEFEAAVWRRIRRVSEPAASTWPVFDLARRWWPEYGWTTATAAIAGIAAGVYLALAPVVPTHEQNAAAPLLQRDTLAGSYLTLLAGGPP